MGILWTVWPLTHDMMSWLDEIGIAYPDGASRFPTGREIKDVISTLTDFDVEITDNGIGHMWQALITSKLGEGEWTLLNIDKYSGDEEEQELWFEKGWESLITSILRELSKSSGPLVLLADVGGDPIVISTAMVPPAD